MILHVKGNVWKLADIRLLRGLRKIDMATYGPPNAFRVLVMLFSFPNCVRSRGAAPGVDLPCQRKPPFMDQVHQL